jgi:transcriptional regulator with XRE-family HTH domain
MPRAITPLQSRLAKLMTELRRESGLSQESLADQAGVHRTLIGLIEHARREPRISSLEPILRVLGVSWEEFGRRLEKTRADSRR